ncbi:MAG: hypothetical protein ABW189_00760 [Rickettsiales bacterium]
MTNNGDSPAAVAVRKTAERCHAAIDRLEATLEAQVKRIEELEGRSSPSNAPLFRMPQPSKE